MARKLKAQGGPLHGKTVIVHETQETFTHHGDTDGHYKVNEKSVTWQPDTKPTATVEKPAPKTTRRPKAKAPTKPTETPVPEQTETATSAASPAE